MSEWAMVHPWMTFFLGLGLLNTVGVIVNRILRSMNIRKAGWPPVHCDADGDFKPSKPIETA